MARLLHIEQAPPRRDDKPAAWPARHDYGSSWTTEGTEGVPAAESSNSTPGKRWLLTAASLFRTSTGSYAVLVFWISLLLPRSMNDPDIWWHLRNVSEQWHARCWLHYDLYSFSTAHAAWINHEWLAEIPFFLAWRCAGDRGLYLVTLFLLLSIFVGVLWLARRSGSGPAALVATLAATTLATVSFGPRTLLAGWACLVVELILLKLSAVRRSLLFALPGLFLFWVNSHGSWLIGLVVLICWMVSGCIDFDRGSIRSPAVDLKHIHTYAFVLLLSIGALFINPYGWRLVVYPFDLAFFQRLNIASIEEWQALDAHTRRGELFLILLAAIGLSQLLYRQFWTVRDICVMAIGVVSAFLHARFLFLAAILVTPILARQIDPLFRIGPSARRPLLSVAFLVALSSVTVSNIVRTARSEPSAGLYPDSALRFLGSFRPRGRILNEYLWGGYLEQHFPRLPIFIDSRVDIFERSGVLRDYLDIVHLKNARALLSKYQIHYVLFERDAPLVSFLQVTHQWNTKYDDGKVVLLELSTDTQSNTASSAETP